MEDRNETIISERALHAAMRGFDEATYGHVDIDPSYMVSALKQAAPIIAAEEHVTVDEIVAAAGLDGGRQVAKAVDKDNPANTLSGCGDEHVLAVIDLVEGWRRAAAQAKRRQV